MTESSLLDRRVQRTQRLLRDALVSLIHEKRYDSIVVKEILARANVGRTAFYAHFADKDALLASGIDHLLTSTAPRPLPPSAARFANVVWFSLPLFEFIGQCRHAARRTMDKRGRAMVHEHMRHKLQRRIADDIRPVVSRRDTPHQVPADLLVAFVVSTFMLVLEWWVDTGSDLAPADVDDLFLSMVLPTLDAAAGAC